MSIDPNESSAPSNPPALRGADAGSVSAIVCGVVLVLTCSLLFAVTGAAVASLLNSVAPGYYPGVFGQAPRQGNAADVGRAVGAFQGQVFGFFVGLALAVGLGRFGSLRPIQCVWVLTYVVGFGIALAGIGTYIGYAIGTFIPDYYRTVFIGGEEPGFKPVDVGIGLGCSEGLMVGVVIGAVFALILTWRRSRSLQSCQAPNKVLTDFTCETKSKGRSITFRVCLGLVHAFIGVIVSGLSLLHMCELSEPAFEDPFLICVPSLCLFSVFWFRRYRYSLLANVVILIIAWNVGQEYLGWLHHH